MTRKPDDWMPLNIGKYLGDTTHLTTPQHGAYLLLLMAYWRRGGPLPADDGRLAAIAKVTPAEWRKLKPVISEFFSDRDGHWHQKRADEELETARTKMAAKSKAGKTGAQNRWHKDGETDDRTNGKQDGTRIADASVCDRQTDTPLPSTLVPVSVEANASTGGTAARLELVDGGKPDWWPKRDRYGRVQGEITDKLLYQVGRAVLGESGGGQVTKLKKLRPYNRDWRAIVDLLLRSGDAEDAGAYFAKSLKNAENDEPDMPMHEVYPESEYRA